MRILNPYPHLHLLFRIILSHFQRWRHRSHFYHGEGRRRSATPWSTMAVEIDRTNRNVRLQRTIIEYTSKGKTGKTSIRSPAALLYSDCVSTPLNLSVGKYCCFSKTFATDLRSYFKMVIKYTRIREFA